MTAAAKVTGVLRGITDKGSDNGDDESEDNSSDDEVDLPITQKFDFQPHTKRITTIALDKKNARMATGSYDEKLHLFDFHGMNRY